MKMPRHVAKVAARYEGSGYISSSQYAELEYAAIIDCKEDVSVNAEKLERVRREAYRQGVEDANRIVFEMFESYGLPGSARMAETALLKRLEQLNKEARG